MSDKGGKSQDSSDKHDKKATRADPVIDGAVVSIPAGVTDTGPDPIPGLPCYHGLIPREDMKEILKENGDFLLRNTELVSGDTRTYCLSVRWGEDVRHFALQKHANQHYCIDGKQYFPSIVNMIDHYSRSGQTFTQYNLALYRPIPREKWEFLHSQVHLKEKLGTGAFGDVHLGTITVENQTVTVAVKTLKCLNQTKEKIEEIMSEARIMRKLDHINIVKCYGVSADIEPLYIIMEFVKGGGLDSFLKKNGDKLDLTHRIRMMLDIASAIDYIHSKKIIHRDIAARNCLYGDEIVKLSDFGMSRFAKVVKLDSNDRSAIRWCAPEAFNKRAVTRASDVWAMGVLFWEVFADGMQPYTGWSLQLVRDQVACHRQHLSMAEDVPKEINDLVIQTFTYEEEKRITAKEVLEKVEQIYKKYVGEDERFRRRRVYESKRKSVKSGKDASPVALEEKRSPADRISNKESIDNKIVTSTRKKKSNKKSALENIRADDKHPPSTDGSKRTRKKSKARRKPNQKDGGSESANDISDDKARKKKSVAIADESKRKLKKNRN